MPDSAVEFHDSALAGTIVDGSTLIIDLSKAYVYRAETGADWDSCWTQEVRLYVAEASMSGQASELPCYVLAGTLRLDGKTFQMMPVPLEHKGEVQLALETNYGDLISFRGNGIRLELLGEPMYVPLPG